MVVGESTAAAEYVVYGDGCGYKEGWGIGIGGVGGGGCVGGVGGA